MVNQTMMDGGVFHSFFESGRTLSLTGDTRIPGRPGSRQAAGLAGSVFRSASGGPHLPTENQRGTSRTHGATPKIYRLM